VIWRGGGEHLELLGKFYIGYSVSVGGAFLGLVYGFVDGFLGGWILAWLYNRFARASA
jgi:ABC-type dipeptide/oligopeptide/nickel transport system permease subunit